MKRNLKNLGVLTSGIAKVAKGKTKPIAGKSDVERSEQNPNSMLNQKTYEDFNKERPDPEDPNLKPTPKPVSAPKKTGKKIPGRK